MHSLYTLEFEFNDLCAYFELGVLIRSSYVADKTVAAPLCRKKRLSSYVDYYVYVHYIQVPSFQLTILAGQQMPPPVRIIHLINSICF